MYAQTGCMLVQTTTMYAQTGCALVRSDDFYLLHISGNLTEIITDIL